jgi:membrane protein implicated in regulation of membrane protease activity
MWWEWLGEHTWVAWTGGGVLLAIAEMLSGDFVLLMLAAGAFGGAATAVLGGPVSLQVLVAVAVALGTLVFVRPSVVRRIHRGPELRTGHAALVGTSAVVVEEITAQSGLVKLAGEVWTARPYDTSSTIPVGVRVDVFEINGATAVVHPADTEI